MGTNTAVWSAVLFAGVALGASSLLSAREPGAGSARGQAGFPKVHLRLDEMAPKDWKAVDIVTDAFPHGKVKPVDGTGLAFTLQSPRTVRGFKGEPALEQLTIWIMPEDYHPDNVPPPGPAIMPARLLGAAENQLFGRQRDASGEKARVGQRYHIYVLPCLDMKSWSTWEKDIRSYFGIRPAGSSG